MTKNEDDDFRFFKTDKIKKTSPATTQSHPMYSKAKPKIVMLLRLLEEKKIAITATFNDDPLSPLPNFSLLVKFFAEPILQRNPHDTMLQKS